MTRLTRFACVLFVFLGSVASLGDEPPNDQATRQAPARFPLDKISPYVLEQLAQQETVEVIVYLEDVGTERTIDV